MWCWGCSLTATLLPRLQLPPMTALGGWAMQGMGGGNLQAVLLLLVGWQARRW